jgi:7-carboxy-7-deazaguanine synthase
MPPSVASLTVNEIFLSIQGESTWAGLPCVFVRLTGCDLRCRYCDTTYAFGEGTRRPLAEVLDKALGFGVPLVEVTGGEPLLQPATLPLLAALCDAGLTVLLETNGARDISGVDARVHRIMDLKAPSSGECARNFWPNLEKLTPRDEVKVVIGSREDYEWARAQVREKSLHCRAGAVLFSAVFGEIEPSSIVSWILEDQLPVRFQLQMHKFIWEPAKRGV